MQAAPPGILIFLRFPIAPDPVESQRAACARGRCAPAVPRLIGRRAPWQSETLSDTFDSLGLDAGAPLNPEQRGTPAMEALEDWGHHRAPDTLSDDVLQRAWQDSVSFVFSNKVEGNIEKLTIGT